MQLSPHSNAWYDWLATQYSGYYYPWRSRIEPGNGEELYTRWVHQHLAAAADVLDVGCGHGEFTLSLAPHCRSITGYDRVSEYIRLAKSAAEGAAVANVQFITHDSAPRAHGGRARMPGEDHAFHLIISRRGPLHWIADARRAARPAATLIQLNPVDGEPPTWNEYLPPLLRLARPTGEPIRAAVARRLGDASICLSEECLLSVSEWFEDEFELYRRLTWGRDRDGVPTFKESAGMLKSVFRRFAGPQGLALPHERCLWKAVIPGTG